MRPEQLVRALAAPSVPLRVPDERSRLPRKRVHLPVVVRVDPPLDALGLQVSSHKHVVVVPAAHWRAPLKAESPLLLVDIVRSKRLYITYF